LPGSESKNFLLKKHFSRASSLHSWGEGEAKEKKNKIKPFEINPSKEDAEKQMLSVITLTAVIARLKLRCGVVLLDLRRERSCISRLLTIS